MRFSDQFLDDIRARLPVSHVAGRKVALKKKGREFAGLSPFKVEKTPSFFVNDQKGFYHCFASGEHGDIFTFVMKMEGLSFPEAVERLAAEAGVPLPKEGPHDDQRADERSRLLAAMEAAASFFERTLGSGAGTEARRYLDQRGVTRGAIAQFRLGYAAHSKSALREHLAKAGFTVEEMVAAGLLIAGDDIPVAYDRFRHRVMFPITDLKGRVIAFGGRALDPDQPAKYMNSPETPLFHKGAILFNAANARPAAHEAGRVIAVEGYMDVIALAQAGLGECVAPLGTALTEDQVRLLWRLAPEPVLCFDGDSAGRKAAFRAVDTVLPHLEPGRSVSFAFLPDGLDPDDLVRRQGADAVNSTLSHARPLVDVLWEREVKRAPSNTPERRAATEARLERLISLIADKRVQYQYRQEVRSRLFKEWRGGKPTARISKPDAEKLGRIFDDVIILALLSHPWLLDEYLDSLVRYKFVSEAHSEAFTVLLDLHARQSAVTAADIEREFAYSHFLPLADQLRASSAYCSVDFVRPETDANCVRQEFEKFIQGTRLDELNLEQYRLKQVMEQDPSEEALTALTRISAEIEAVTHSSDAGGRAVGVIDVDFNACIQKLLPTGIPARGAGK